MDFIETPYDNYRSSALWLVVEKSLNLLEDNQDIEVTTHPDYIIGYLVKSIEDLLKNRTSNIVPQV